MEPGAGIAGVGGQEQDLALRGRSLPNTRIHVPWRGSPVEPAGEVPPPAHCAWPSSTPLATIPSPLSSVLNHHPAVWPGGARKGSCFSSSSPRPLKREPGHTPFLGPVPALSLGEPPTPVQIPASSPQVMSPQDPPTGRALPTVHTDSRGHPHTCAQAPGHAERPDLGRGEEGGWPTTPRGTALTPLRWAGPEGVSCGRPGFAAGLLS